MNSSKDDSLSLPLCVTDYIGFAIDPSNSRYHIKPRSDMNPKGSTKKLLNGGELKKSGVDFRGLLFNTLKEKSVDTYPIYPATSYQLGSRCVELMSTVSERWDESLRESQFTSQNNMAKAYLLISGADQIIVNHRFKKNPQDFDNLWPGKMLAQLLKKMNQMLEESEVSDKGVNARIGTFWNELRDKNSDHIWFKWLIKLGREKEVLRLILAAHTIKLNFDGQDDLCFKALWLAAFLMNNIEVFVLSVYQLEIDIDPSDFPFYNADVVGHYFEFLSTRNHSGFTNIETISYPLVLLSKAKQAASFSFENPLFESWGKLLDLKHLLANVDEDIIQQQLAVGYFKGLISLLDKEIQHCEFSNSTSLVKVRDTLLEIDNDSSLKFNIIGPYGNNPAFEWLNEAELRIETVADNRKRQESLVGKKNFHTVKFKNLTQKVDPLCDSSFGLLEDERAELKSLVDQCESVQAKFEEACKKLLKHAEKVKLEVILPPPEKPPNSQSVEAYQAAEISRLEETANEQKHRIYKLQVELDRLKERNVEIPSQNIQMEQSVSIPISRFGAVLASRTPTEALLKALEGKHMGRCIIAPCAWKSVAQNRSFERLEVFYDKLDLLLSEAFIEAYDSNGSDAAFSFFTKSELAFNESETTMNSNPRSRTFKFDDGLERVCEKHLKLGVSGNKQYMLRIYFTIENSVIYIGEITDHLPVSRKH